MPRTTTCLALLLAAALTVPADAATFLFIRHAESKANAGTATTPEEMLDPPLTELGEQQAQSLATRLAGRNITTIYTSGYQRTQQTIAPTAAEFGLKPIVDPRTNEWYLGDSNGTGAGLSDAYAVIGAWAAGNTAAKLNLPNAESLDDLSARVLPAWNEIIAAHKNDSGTIAIVGHGAATGYVLPYLAKNVTPGFAFANGLRNTGIVELEIVNGQPYVTNWQDVALAVPAGVPEASTWAMTIGGIGMAGGVLRRRRQQAAVRVRFA